MRPKPESEGMPTNFFFAVSFFSRLAAPLILNDWAELEPKLEPWMESHIVVMADNQQRTLRRRASVWPTNTVTAPQCPWHCCDRRVRR